MSIRNAFDIGVFSHDLDSELDPGAGNNLDIQPPLNTRSELLFLAFTFTTDVNVADRIIHIYLTRGAHSPRIAASLYQQPASTTAYYVIGQHGIANSTLSSTVVYISIPSLPILHEGDHVIAGIENVQVGDAISAVTRLFKVWVAK